MEKEYLSATETAKLMRKDLKANFPGIKFSVRSDRNSINIKYTDGPAEKVVQAVARKYEGAGFDGMIDLQYYISHWMNKATGEVIIAKDQGSTGSGGCHEGHENACPGEGWVKVNFGAKYIFVNQEITAVVMEEAVEMVAKKTGHDDLPKLGAIKKDSTKAGWVDMGAFACNGRDWHDAKWINNLVYETAREIATGEYMVKEAA